MLVFHGGLTSEQVQLLYENRFVIFKMVPKGELSIPDKNTFDYYDANMNFTSQKEFWNTVRYDIYYNQYFYFFKYLKNALEFCHNSSKQNYILVADIDEDILNRYIGCGRYIGNQIEYRVPRKYVKLDTIHDILYFESYNEKQVMELKNKYPNHFSSESENQVAEEIMKQKQLTFNEYKKKISF